jgi:hypothetical protein
MPAHYGEIVGTEGVDGDPVDAYIGNNPGGAQKVWVVDQIDPKTKKFDEHKAMVGFGSESEARATYEAGFSDGSGKSRLGAITEMERDEFVEWVNDETRTRQPLSYGKKPRLTRHRKVGKSNKSFDASPKLVYLDSDGNPTTTPQDQLRPEIRLESAIRVLQKWSDGGAGRGASAAERAAELTAFAQENGLVLDPEAFSITVASRKTLGDDGSEHSVYYDKATSRVIKITHGDFVGNGSVGQSPSALDYLKSLQGSNILFGDDIRFEGIVSIEGEFPQIVISQPHVSGREATPQEIHDFMTDREFKLVDGSWQKGGITVSDAGPKNVMAVDEKDGSVTVVPFDVQVVGNVSAADAKFRTAPSSAPTKISPPRATTQDVQRKFRSVVEALRVQGINIRMVKTAIGELVDELGKYQEWEGRTGDLVRTITLTMSDTVKPTLENFITVLHDEPIMIAITEID